MKHFIQYNGLKIEYSIVYRNRKTVGISVSAERGVQVAAPKWVSKSQIHEIILGKAPWVLNKLSYINEIKASTPEKDFKSGENILYLGENLQLGVQEHPQLYSSSVSLIGDKILVTIPSHLSYDERRDVIRYSLIEWYKNRVSDIVKERLQYFTNLTGLQPVKVLIKEHKRIWGSCTGKNTININWKIVMAPLPIIDYLIVHELAHIKIKNHSSQFWNLVASILPDCKESSKWLKKNGYKLRI